MRFYVKTIARAIVHRMKHPAFLYKKLTTTTFPAHEYPEYLINLRLEAAYHDISSGDIRHNIGSLSPKVNSYAASIYKKFLTINPNNIGNWSITPPSGGTRLLEFEVVHKLIDLYNAGDQRIEGYVTSGGTEGNIFSVWVAKAFLTKTLPLNQICLLKTDLTHYSIDKAGFICSIKQSTIPLHPESWTMDPEALESEILLQMKQGITGFIISLTLGYTETGSSDSIDAISNRVALLKKKNPELTFSIIIDAAFNGLIEPFIQTNFRPFSCDHVHAFSIDFSKFTAVPYPAGVVLYRKQLRKIIERSVPVFSMPDNTLLGSRPGAAVAAIWASLHKNGIRGFARSIRKQMNVKEYFIQKMKILFPNAEILTDPNSLTCGIILNKKYDQALPEEAEERFWIYAKRSRIAFSNGKIRTMRIYKFFFLPHITKSAIDDIIKILHKHKK